MDRARPLSGPPPGVQARLLGPLGPRAPAGPPASALPVPPREDRDSVCPPKLFSLNYKSSMSNRSYRPALGSCPGTCALPRGRLGPCQEREQSRTPLPGLWGLRVGKRGKELGSSTSPENAHWMLLNHMTLPVSHRFGPKKLAISCHST